MTVWALLLQCITETVEQLWDWRGGHISDSILGGRGSQDTFSYQLFKILKIQPCSSVTTIIITNIIIITCKNSYIFCLFLLSLIQQQGIEPTGKHWTKNSYRRKPSAWSLSISLKRGPYGDRNCCSTCESVDLRKELCSPQSAEFP